MCGDKAWSGEDVWKDHSSHNKPGGFPFPGVYLQPNFLNEEEEAEMTKGCDAMEWDLSQSGRRKQVKNDYLTTYYKFNFLYLLSQLFIVFLISELRAKDKLQKKENIWQVL